jgi:hypothetical protein
MQLKGTASQKKIASQHWGKSKFKVQFAIVLQTLFMSFRITLNLVKGTMSRHGALETVLPVNFYTDPVPTFQIG